MRVVLLSAVAGRETGQIMTNSRKRHTPEQVVRKLGQADRMLADGQDVAAVCRELMVSEQTYYRWRNQYGGLKADDAKRLKELEKQNATLKRLLAEAELENGISGGSRVGRAESMNFSMRPIMAGLYCPRRCTSRPAA